MISIDGTGLSQWDKGREAIVDVKEATHVHLANQGDSMAAICEIANGMVKIPDYLLQTGKTLIAYAVKKGEGDNLVTLEKQVFPVRNRERPEEYIYDADQRNFVYTLVQEAQEATKAANQVAQDLIAAKDRGDFNGPPGEPGAPGSALIDDSTVRKDASWSSLNTIDKLCPSFEKSGTLVQCEPVEGSTITVSTDSHPGDGVLTICGKNLYNGDTETGYPLTDGKMIRHAYGTFANATAFSATEDYIPCAHLQGQTISIRHAPTTTTETGSSTAGIAFYKAKSTEEYITGTWKSQITVPENAQYMRFSIDTRFKGEAQIEIGDVVTDYSKYWGYWKKPISVMIENFPLAITAKSGVHTVYLTERNMDEDQPRSVTVTGKADPVALIKNLTKSVEQLQSAIIATGANI